MTIEIKLDGLETKEFHNGNDAFAFCQQHRPYWDWSHLRADGREICSLGEFMERNAERRKVAELRTENRLKNKNKI